MIEFYVDATHGSDTAGDGTLSNPYKTVSNILTKLTNDPNIYHMEGTHNVHSLVDITSSSYIINYIGKGLETVVEVEYCYTCVQFRNKTTVKSLRKDSVTIKNSLGAW